MEKFSLLFYLDHFMELLLLPPGNILLLILLAFLLWKRWPLLGKVLISTTLIAFWTLSTPFMARILINSLQDQYQPIPPSKLTTDKDAAIVVLEAGLNMQTPEYGEPVVSERTLSRIRYGAFLHNKTNIPILVSGNNPANLAINHADYMADALKYYFNVPTKWKESHGFNTALEAILSVEILKKYGIKKIYLVTHAFHMPRSVYAFGNRGIEIIPCPTGYFTFEDSLGKLSLILPSIEALNESSIALREYIGIIWYRMYYQF